MYTYQIKVNTNMKDLKNGLIIVLFTFFSCTSCTESSLDKEFDNPLDPESDAYNPPGATILEGPSEGEIFSTDSIEFSWSGESPNNRNKFKYILNGPFNKTSGWIDDQSVVFDNLDDGKYVFKLLEKYSTGIVQKDTTERVFNIDAVRGPALRFENKYIESNLRDSLKVHIVAEEVSDLMGVHLKIKYDTFNLKYKHIRKHGAFFDIPPKNIILLNESYDQYIEIDFVVLGSGDKLEIVGSDKMLTLTFLAHTRGLGYISFIPSNCIMRDSQNLNITINDFINGQVLIE